MKSNLLTLIPVLAILLLSCTESQSHKTNPGESTSKNLVPSEITAGSETSQEVTSGIEEKIQWIRTECTKIDQFFDWTQVKNLDVWGATGVGTASYYYSDKDLLRISFYPSGDLSARYYTFYFKNKKPIFAELKVEVEPGKMVNTNFKSNCIAGNISPNSFSEDRIPIAYTVKFYFDNGEVFHEEIVHGTAIHHAIVGIAKEKKRLKEELELLLKEA